jgi:MoaA/NifB/PqqE/SkfB family radical SAM enzyme
MLKTFKAILIQTIDLCNRSCAFCPNKYDLRKSGAKMTTEVFEKVLADLHSMHYCGRISPYLMNEPLLDSRIFDMIARIRELFPENVVSLNTNGDALMASTSVSERLVGSGVDAVLISCYDQEAEFERLSKFVRDLASRFPKVLLDDYGSPVRIRERNGRMNLRVRWVPEALPSFWNRGGNAPNPVPTHSMAAIGECRFPRRKMYINYKGEAVLCCSDWRFEVVLGNVRDATLAQIWRGREYKRIRELHRGGRAGDIPLCRACNRIARS